MLTFYCTRCGARLQIDDDLAGQTVRCGSCSTTVRSPELIDEIPVAEVAAEIPSAAVVPQPVLPLDYARAWRPPIKPGAGEMLEVFAERLGRIESPEAVEGSAMTNCPHCGSTIAPYIGRCPFCRHPLRGS